MQWFKFYMGDFERDTGRLSLAEKGAYIALMSSYYAEESPLPSDKQQLYRIAGAHTKPEQAAVRSVLKYFDMVDGSYRHKRIDGEIAKACARAKQNKINAMKGAKR